MKYLKFIIMFLLIFSCKKDNQKIAKSKELIIIEQDYHKALNLANKQKKLLFIDFYTTWCAPCKKLEKLVFKNDSIKNLLGENFVLLKYDAEKDTIFNLSKKHHISSYPTGLILNNEGFVVNRKYGFIGEDSLSLQENVLKFTNKAISLSTENKLPKGYSNKIEPEKYPQFYVDYINRTNTKINGTEIANYLNNTTDKFSEQYFSTLIYFGRRAPESIANMVLKNKEKYINLYGNSDVEILLYFLTSVKFNIAITQRDKEKYNEAVAYTRAALSQKWVIDILPNYEKDFLKAQNNWDQVFEINKKLKDEGKFDNGYVNHFCWEVYEKCNNKQVIKSCIKWMKDITVKEPTFYYLDTYAHLLHKSGNQLETNKIAKLAIEVAKNESTTKLERLIHKK